MNELIYVSPSCVGEHLVHLTSILAGGTCSHEEQPRKQNLANLIGGKMTSRLFPFSFP